MGQRDALAAILAGNHAIVDNTSMESLHWTIYRRIAAATGAELIQVVVAPELWLNCSDDIRADTIATLLARNAARALNGTKAKIPPEAITATINRAREDYARYEGGRGIEGWLASAPVPSYPMPLVWERDALMFRSPLVDQLSAAALSEPRVQLHTGISSARVMHDIARGIDEAHITLISP